MKTILYLTDNTLDETIASKCRKMLVKAAGENPIISVSQKPINLGRNICVGEIGRSWMSLMRQELAGLWAADTKYVAVAEHDCLYTQEHFDWMPPCDDVFYYNRNHYLVEWHGNHPELDGMYSQWSPGRNALSQLICSRVLLIGSIEEKLELLDKGLSIMKKAGEPGACPEGFIEAAKIATSGKCYYLMPYLEAYVRKYRHEPFQTALPNLDIRHKTNFTGPRRGKHRTYSIPYWGEFKSLWGGEE